MKSIQKIIWAADPLEDKELMKQGIGVLRDLAKKTHASVEPVYVLSDILRGLSTPLPELVRQFKEPATRALASLRREAGISSSSKGTVLVAVPTSRGGASEVLDRYAQKKHADLIFVSSHGRSGFKRAVLGSFAETLLLHTKTPVLISGPKTRELKGLEHILFPTDFSKGSRKVFEKVQALAKKLNAEITILHIVRNSIEPFVQSGTALLGGGYVSMPILTSDLEEQGRKLAEALAAQARKNGVKAEVAVDMDSGGVISSIVKYAERRRVGMIAMASESSAFRAVVLGSVGRGVARVAPCPVWFMRA